MKLTIFSRLITGYVVILMLAMAVNVYSIMQLRQMEDISHSILLVDNRIMEYEKKLSDALISMIEYEKKYIIIKDDGLYNNFIRVKGEFDDSLGKMASVSDSSETDGIINGIRREYDRYQTAFTEEAGYLSSAAPYPADRYKSEKEDAVNGIVEGLKQLRVYSQENTVSKIRKLGEAEVRASRMAIIMGSVSLAAGVLVSVFITVNITRPVSAIKRQTQKIAAGDFSEDLNLTSPPEIAALAQSFNMMCARLKELDRMKSDFFSLMSHELRTPLTTIKEGITLYLEGMMEGAAPDRQKKLLTIINEEVNRLINLVNSVMDFSKMEAGMMSYNFIDADIVPLIERVVREMGPLVETRKIDLTVTCRDGLPRVKVDIERILQVLRNLMANAVKFTPNSGDVTVTAQSVDDGVQVSVSDTGAGISEEKLSSVFDKYQQAVFPGQARTIGSGLGLFIVKQIITAHGGKVWAESTPGHGSTFSFVLPA